MLNNQQIQPRKSVPLNSDYRSLMKNVLMIGFFLPFVPMILVSGITYYQLHSAYEEAICKYTIETTKTIKGDIAPLFNEKKADLQNGAAARLLGELCDDSSVHRQIEEILTDSGLNRARIVILMTILLAGLLLAANAYGLSRKTVHSIELADAKKQKVNEQMFQTGKLASIGELASGIAHEINNPVAIMVEEAGWIDDLLQEEEFKESENLGEFKRALKQIRAQGNRCKEITHKLLSFARKTDFRGQPVQLSELIEDITAISVKSTQTNLVIIVVDVQEDLPLLSLPRTEVQQVLLNLVKNALDAMEDKGGTISISAHLVKDNLMIKVSDNGPGIPKEDLKRVFDPFYTTKPVGKGTGLGLSICYGIVSKMGGEIGVESLEDMGTTFRVVIPISKEGENGAVSFANTRDSHKSAGTLCL